MVILKLKAIFSRQPATKTELDKVNKSEGRQYISTHTHAHEWPKTSKDIHIRTEVLLLSEERVEKEINASIWPFLMQLVNMNEKDSNVKSRKNNIKQNVQTYWRLRKWVKGNEKAKLKSI